jgi:hypothetical protein
MAIAAINVSAVLFLIVWFCNLPRSSSAGGRIVRKIDRSLSLRACAVRSSGSLNTAAEGFRAF